MIERRVVAAFGLSAVVGCATVDPQPDYERISRHVTQAVGQAITVDPEGASAAAAKSAELLKDGLTMDEAVQLGLLNNPRLQASFLGAGVGRAEVVQSGLFSNPGVAFSFRLPDEGGLANFEVSLAQNLAELWQIGARREAAERDLDRTLLALAREASAWAWEVREGYVSAVRADREAVLARESLALAEQVVELAIARRQAGSGNEVDVNLSRAERVTLEVTSRKADAAAVTARAALSTSLGITSKPTDLVLLEGLPEAGELPIGGERVIAAARASRLDLKSADAVVQASRARLELERSRVFQTVTLGVSLERAERRPRGDRDWLAETAWASLEAGAASLPSLQPRESVATDYVIGPTLSLEAPLFDQNQAQVARAEYELLAAEYLKESIERQIVQEAWAAETRVRVAVQNARMLREELLPLREKGLELGREAYRLGGGTLLTVLETQRSLLDARVAEVQALADAALALLELQRIAGRPLATLTSETETEAWPSLENQP